MRKIICIGRQSGSNGRAIAQKIAQKLNIPCYDRELLEKAAEDSGLSKELLQQADERAANPFLYSRLYVGETEVYYGKNVNDILYLAQKQVIQELAEKEDAVFVGRCADDILKHNPDYFVLSAFITASMKYKIKIVMEREKLGEKAAAALIRKVDKARKAYFDYYTDRDWGKPSDYDLTLNASSLGEDKIVEILTTLYQHMS